MLPVHWRWHSTEFRRLAKAKQDTQDSGEWAAASGRGAGTAESRGSTTAARQSAAGRVGASVVEGGALYSLALRFIKEVSIWTAPALRACIRVEKVQHRDG